MAFNYSPKVITDGLVLYLDAANTRSYPGSGTAWNDLSRSGNNGTLTNGPTFSSGNGGSIVFDGVDDFVGITNTLLSSTDNFSMEVWFNATLLSTSNKLIFYIGNTGGSGAGFYMGVCNGTPTTLSVLFGGVICSEVSQINLTTNTWYHAIFTRNSSANPKNILYINGVSVSTGNSNPNTFTSQLGYTATIGGIGNGTQVFPGRVSISRTYNRTLTSTEVLQNYNALKGRFGL
jgi:hypothetical protein